MTAADREARAREVIQRLTGCHDIIGYGGLSLAAELTRALQPPPAGEGAVERVAGTLAYYHYGKALDELKDDDANHCRDLARAALAAMQAGVID